MISRLFFARNLFLGGYNVNGSFNDDGTLERDLNILTLKILMKLFLSKKNIKKILLYPAKYVTIIKLKFPSFQS